MDRGFVDIGVMSSLLFDMRRLGADMGPLQKSAESFLKMWERIFQMV